jgi:membrane protease YdiL (CAAX protease family)
MARYRFLRVLRTLLWGAFLVACVLFALVNLSTFKLPDVVLYAPAVTLVLACLIGALEWMVRRRQGLPVKPSFLFQRDDNAEYRFLAVLRMLLWGAFLLACLLFALVNITTFRFPDLILYAPAVTLALACLNEVSAWIVRSRDGS